MLDFICPFCNEGEPINTCPAGTLPKGTYTGNNGMWQQNYINHTCPHCQNTFEISVRISLQTGAVLFINQTPKPQKVGIVWYVMASINEFGIKVSALCRDEVLTRIIGLSHNRKHFERLHLLKVTSEGYFNEEGRQLAEYGYDEQKINYLEI